MGASNELPESEELDALYDRFLLRRRVAQVSGAGLMELLARRWDQAPQALALADPGSPPRPGGGPAGSKPLLAAPELESVRERALAGVEVPAHVLGLLADLRTHLQEERDPPTYVSDRRLVKAVVLLQVAAYTSGRSRVMDYDTLLLRNVLCYDPADERHVTDWLLQHIAAADGLQQPRFLLKCALRREKPCPACLAWTCMWRHARGRPHACRRGREPIPPPP